MTVPRRPTHRIERLARQVALAASALLLAASLALPVLEWRWAPGPVPGMTPLQAFTSGSIGTELAPLPVMQVLPDLFPKHFRPNPTGGDWIEQFGFIRSANPGDLPVGFVVSHYRPGSALGSPVPFVGFSCAACHSNQIVLPGGGRTETIYGAGNSALNLSAWFDAFRSAVLARDESDRPILSASAVDRALEKKRGTGLSYSERIVTTAWLIQIRGVLTGSLPKYDEPYGGEDLLNSAFLRQGPGRTHPFGTLVSTFLDRPPRSSASSLPSFGYSKIPAVYRQDRRERAQFDGSVSDKDARSMLAAFTVGATAYNLAHPVLSENIRATTRFTTALDAPKFNDYFAPPSPERVLRGSAVYAQHCAECHGQPTPNGDWARGSRQGEVVPPEVVGTDAERVTFRYADVLSDRLYKEFADFPGRHPLAFDRSALHRERGYINAPLEGVFSRAPYLHNASVLTLSELIGLEKRRTKFFRGYNEFDPTRVGLVTPDAKDGAHPFEFETSAPGNSNAGHEYPWPYDPTMSDERREQLLDLLEYLKTL